MDPMMILSVLVGVLVMAAVSVLVFGLYRLFAPADDLDARVDDWLKGERSPEVGVEAGQTPLDRLDRRVGQRGFARGMREDLDRADLKLTVTEYMLIRGVVIVAAVLAGYLLQRSLLTALLTGVLGIFLPTLYVRFRQSQRLRMFKGQLPDVLDHLVGSLRAGYGLMQAVEWVARQIPDPAGAEFDRVIREVQLGRGLMDSLDNMVRRIPSDDLALIVTAIKIQHETGGKLADVLETTGHTIRERVRIEREINVLTAQQRYSGYVLMVMPIALAIFLMIINPEYEMELFTPGPTLCIPIGAGVMMILGFLVMRRIVDIEV